MVKIQVDNTDIEVEEGLTLLQACLDNNIYIPNLCYLKGMEHPAASCRMCFVEIAGVEKPVASCTVKVEKDMIVKTDTPSVRRLQRSALQLLLSAHDVDCKVCHANKKCELQRIAQFLKVGLKPKRLEHHLKEKDIDSDHPCLNFYPNRCVLCAKCVYVCRNKHGRSLLSFARRGFDTVIGFYLESDSQTLPCTECTACIEICPVGALAKKNT
jgi:NADH dehydrogenase/NADH:ubiquinone oxidoreductase subunit G